MCGWSLSSGAEDLGWLGWLGGNGRSARWGSVAGRLSLRRHGLDLQYVRLMFPHDMYGDNPQAGSDLHLIFPAQVRETSSRRNSKSEKLQVRETPSERNSKSEKLQVRETPSRRNSKWEKLQVGETPSRRNSKSEKLQVEKLQLQVGETPRNSKCRLATVSNCDRTVWIEQGLRLPCCVQEPLDRLGLVYLL